MKHKKIVLFALTLYILALFYILFFCRINSDNGMAYNEWLSTSINIMPLKNVFIFLTTPYITPSYVFSFIKNIFGNIMLFLPMGYFLPCLLFETLRMMVRAMLIKKSKAIPRVIILTIHTNQIGRLTFASAYPK